MRPRRARALAGATVVLLLIGGPARAESPARPTTPREPAARPSDGALERAARAAFASGDYGFAIQAWLRVYATTGRHALLLDVARAHRARWQRDADPRDLVDAVVTYRRFLRATPPRGTGRAEAERELAELERVEGQHGPAEPRRSVTRLGVLSDTLAAEVSLDGGPFTPAPRLAIVAPGKHRVVVRAPEHRSVERAIVVGRGGVVALDVRLEPEPAELVLRGAEDAAVHIDGRRVELPEDDEPLRIAPGAHLVAVTQTGFRPFALELDLRRGKRRTVEVELDATAQRAGAISLLTVGGLGLTGGIVLGALSVDADRNSRTGAASDFRTASGVVGVSGVLALVAGGTLLILDEPEVPSAPTLSATPHLGPGRVGVGLTTRF